MPSSTTHYLISLGVFPLSLSSSHLRTFLKRNVVRRMLGSLQVFYLLIQNQTKKRLPTTSLKIHAGEYYHKCLRVIFQQLLDHEESKQGYEMYVPHLGGAVYLHFKLMCDNIRTLYVLSIIQTEPQHTIITCDPHRTNQSYQSILLRGIHICSKTSILRN
jgi:hypothetical protein